MCWLPARPSATLAAPPARPGPALPARRRENFMQKTDVWNGSTTCWKCYLNTAVCRPAFQWRPPRPAPPRPAPLAPLPAEFMEMFVGVGAARVRDMFRQARAQVKLFVVVVFWWDGGAWAQHFVSTAVLQGSGSRGSCRGALPPAPLLLPLLLLLFSLGAGSRDCSAALSRAVSFPHPPAGRPCLGAWPCGWKQSGHTPASIPTHNRY